MKVKSQTRHQYKKRKVIFSVTLDPDLVVDSVNVSEDGNFSRHTENALKHYNKYLAERDKK